MLPRNLVKTPCRALSAHAARAAAATDAPPPPPKKLAKRKLALHVAYVGTGFRGLQWQSPAQSTGASGAEPMENVLERALVAAGAILPSNAGAPAKINWTRASRTDRGVHAAPVVVAMRAECDSDSFETDPEGSAFAAAVNAHLPRDVRVLSAQRVPGGWCARSMCETREYEFHVPAWLVRPKEAQGVSGGSADADALARMRATLALYQYPPALPFHCFTKRSEYRKKGAVKAAVVSTPGQGFHSAATSSLDDADRPFMMRPVWHGDDPPPGDAVGPAHYRMVLRAEACDPAPLTPGGPPAVTVRLRGNSFMLHQIRHMIGVALAVARGVLPVGAVAAALTPPARVGLPLAPPHALVLTGAAFGAYPAAALGGAPAVWFGDRLELRSVGAAALADFRASVLLPSLSAALDHPDWAEWDGNLDRLAYEEEGMAAFVEAGAAWRAAAVERTVARAEARREEGEVVV